MRVQLHPSFRVTVNIDAIYNIDLSSRGFYQIRLQPKVPNEYLNVDVLLQNENDTSPIISAFVDNNVAYSRAVELVYVEENLSLSDTFHFNVQVPPSNDLKKCFTFSLVVELWFLSRDHVPSVSQFSLENSQLLEITLDPCSLNAISRPVHFDFKSPCILSVSVFSSLIAIMPRRRKSPPDPPGIPKSLEELYQSMTSATLKTLLSIEQFVVRFSSCLKAAVNIDLIDMKAEEEKITARLKKSERPWATLEGEAVELSLRIDNLLKHFLELFLNYQPVRRALYKDFFEWRLRFLGEAFFFVERPIYEIQDNPCYSFSQLRSAVLKTKYLNSLSLYPVHCPSNDGPPTVSPIIFEECFSMGPRDDEESSTSTPQQTRVVKPVLKPEGRKSIHEKRSILFRKKSSDSASSGRLKRGSKDDGKMPLVVLSSTEEKTKTPKCSTETTVMEEKVFEAAKKNEELLMEMAQFVKQREVMKEKLLKLGYEGNLYSELASLSVKPAILPPVDNGFKPSNTDPIHLIVMLHGLEGYADDLSPYKNALKLAAPGTNFHFLMSNSNHELTYNNFEVLAANLLKELKECMLSLPTIVDRISFIAHSMGGILVRALLALDECVELYPVLHTLLTINSPHLGLTYAGRHVNLGLHIVQWFKKSESMEQLSMKDKTVFSETFLVRLATKRTFGKFKHILLIGGPNDMFVPCHSSVIDCCKEGQKDLSALGEAYRSMVAHINEDIMNSNVLETVVKYYTYHSYTSTPSNRLTFRAAHLAPIEDDLFVEKLLSISALKYFV